jgi:hypothetical protein
MSPISVDPIICHFENPVVPKTSESASFKESAEWIVSHPNAMLHDVPDRLVQRWIHELNDPSTPIGFPLSVFTFGYCQRQLDINGAPAKERYSVAMDTVLRLFQMWQLKLGLIEVHRKSNIQIGPMALFDFPSEESIEYWRGDSPKPS